MNVYDSERIADAVFRTHSLITDPIKADAILLNTCHIREKAAEKVYSEIGKLAILKRKQAFENNCGRMCSASRGKSDAIKTTNYRRYNRPQMYQTLPDILADKLNKKIF